MANNEMVREATPTKGFSNRGSNYAAKQAKLDADEAEIAALVEAHAGGDTPTPEVEATEPQEEVVETEETQEEDDSNLSREEKSFKKRYGDLRRHMAEKEKEWKASLDSSNTSSVRPPSSDEDIEEWASKYPEIAAIVETIADKKASAKFAQAEDRFKELDEAKFEATRTKAETAIRKAHSDFDELREADEFHDWVEEQPKWVRDALYENSDDAQSVVRVLDLYKVDKGMTPSAKKAKAKDAAKTVTKRKARTQVDADSLNSQIRESDVQKMSDSEFEDRYEEIQGAMASGKFVYDISGKAR
jgi:hypothetical protein